MVILSCALAALQPGTDSIASRPGGCILVFLNLPVLWHLQQVAVSTDAMATMAWWHIK